MRADLSPSASPNSLRQFRPSGGYRRGGDGTGCLAVGQQIALFLRRDARTQAEQ